jgi:hypothetical protein
MVEAGVRFVTVNGWTGQATHDKQGPPSSSWDMHGGNMGMGNAFGDGSYGLGFRMPRLDQALSALLSDLKDRGMLKNTLVVCMGEFGRTPNILTQEPPAVAHWPVFLRHWPAVAFAWAVMASPTNTGAVESNPVRPEEMAATIYHALDVPLNAPKTTAAFRPITTGKPLLELFG